MKSVLISIQPKWCELIASGKKTVEVRKTAPKLQTPFKCYIYCANEKHKGEVLLIDGGNVALGDYRNAFHWKNVGNGKVIGEFVCDRIKTIGEGDTWRPDLVCERACLTIEELRSYAPKCPFYLWHISDLKIYDKPRELTEFLVKGECENFDSHKELRRYLELCLLERSGQISDLKRQVKFELIPAQKDEKGKCVERAVSYIADFVYQDENGKTVVEDTKGVRTKEYVIKRKLLLWRCGIRIKEI